VSKPSDERPVRLPQHRRALTYLLAEVLPQHRRALTYLLAEVHGIDGAREGEGIGSGIGSGIELVRQLVLECIHHMFLDN